jgi:hypothetical protein
MNNLFKMLGLLSFVLIGLGSAQTPTSRYESERNAIIKKWTDSNPKSFPLIDGTTFEAQSKISENAGQGPLVPAIPTAWRDILQSESLRTKELRTWYALREEPTPIYFLNQSCVDCLVKNSLVVVDDSTLASRKVEATEKIAKEEAARIAAREKIIQDEQRRKLEVQQNIETLRSAAKNDVVAQALNYVSGYGEDAKNSDSYYPLERNNGNCIFSRFDSWNKLTVKLDLNKGNPDTLEFESMTMNSDIRLVWYITRVEGLGEFRCLNCNSSRVQRAWALIYRECKGTRKAF